MKGEEKRLVLERRGRSWTFPLTSAKEPRLYREYFDEYVCAYEQGGFATPDGLDLTALPRGTYEASVIVSSPDEGIERRTRLIASRPLDARQALGDSELLVRGGGSGVKITKRHILGEDTGGVRFSLEKSWRRERTVHAEGVFFLPGRNADKKGHAHYYLVLQGRRGCFSFPLEARKNAAVVRAHRGRGDIGAYPFGYFTTPGDEGVDVSALPAEPVPDIRDDEHGRRPVHQEGRARHPRQGALTRRRPRLTPLPTGVRESLVTTMRQKMRRVPPCAEIRSSV